MSAPHLRPHAPHTPPALSVSLQIVPLLLGLLRGLKLYHRSNQVIQLQLIELAATLAASLDEETLVLTLGDQLYLNGTRLRPTQAQSHQYRSLANEFHSRGLAGLRIRKSAAIEELEAFLGLMVAASTPDAGQRLAAECIDAGIPSVTPILERDLAGMGADALLDDDDASAGQEGGATGERARARMLYHGAVAGAQHALVVSAASGRPALQQARRVVQPLVDRILKDELSLIGLTALKDHDEYTYAHCVNVSVLSIRIGQILGLPRAELADLGVAALLHDIGKVSVPVAILQKPGRLDTEEWAAIRRHPVEGFKLACQVPNLTRQSVEVARVALEHHVTLDGKGYPSTIDAARVSTSARIVAVADFFDAVTAHRAYRRRPLTPFEALHLLLLEEASKFDPAVVWGLLRAVGHFPAGTFLESRRGFVVVSLSPDVSDGHRPHCQVLVRPDGSRPPEDAPEYWDPMPESDAVERVIPPEELDAGEQDRLSA